MQCVTSLLFLTTQRKEGLETVTFVLFWINRGNKARKNGLMDTQSMGIYRLRGIVRGGEFHALRRRRVRLSRGF
jgi:hypothetical protein